MSDFRSSLAFIRLSTYESRLSTITQTQKQTNKQTNKQKNADSRISGYVWTGPKTAMFVTLEKDWFPAIVTGSRQACTTGTAGKAVTLKPSFQSEAKCEAIDMKITFYSEAKWSSLSQGKVLHFFLHVSGQSGLVISCLWNVSWSLPDPPLTTRDIFSSL